MTATAMAHENKECYQRRLAVVKDLIHGLGLEDTDITPVRWDESQIQPYNNFIYRVALSSPALPAHFTAAARQPCSELPPAKGVSTVIVRLSNPRAKGLNNTNRVENEVAAMHLLRGALAQLGPDYASLVPAVYAWKPAAGPNPVDETGFGWSVMEYLKGSSLYAGFQSLDMMEKKRVITEIATIFSAMQNMKLPPGVDRFGGLTITKDGSIVSGQETLQALPGGPWPEYEGFWRHQLFCQLKVAENHELIQGWRAHGIRERIETFSGATLDRVIQEAGVDTSKLAFINVDFTMGNMLYDTEAKRISGVVDFDWAAVNHPGHEYFFTSLQDVYGNPREQKSEKLRQAISTSDFSASKDASEKEHAEAWELAKTWDEAVKERGGLRFSDIRCMKTLEKLNAFTDLLFPFQLTCADDLGGQSAAQKAEARAGAEKAIDEMLCEWGV